MIISLEKEKRQRVEQELYACPDCGKERKFCPDFTQKPWPTIEEFESWPLKKKSDFLHHTRYLS